ncbi:hypothetical protein [Tateyamaria sp. 1078]|uniref:hypothetical protein n=1 Tax=Tateyamaria sp. 1078 TaxID=3417464 RepID=UPI003EBD87C3
MGAGVAGERALRIWSDDNLPAAAVTARATDAATSAEPTPPLAATQWPALFGELQPPAPPAPPAPEPVAEPQPPKPPAPPLDSLGFALKGVVRAGDAVWGLVSHPTGERILRVGDEMAHGFTVHRIDEQGLWLDNGGDTPVLMGFPEG